MVKSVTVQLEVNYQSAYSWFNKGCGDIEILFLISYAIERIFKKKNNCCLKAGTQCPNEVQDYFLISLQCLLRCSQTTQFSICTESPTCM